jgi:serine/threonine-protein kinase ATR
MKVGVIAVWMAILICYMYISGGFRIACEMTMRVLRENHETIMSIMSTFIHDPLVEWVRVGSNEFCTPSPMQLRMMIER